MAQCNQCRIFSLSLKMLMISNILDNSTISVQKDELIAGNFLPQKTVFVNGVNIKKG